ncbi:DUF7619 domain-containing protein [Flavobacterium sp. XGLA_31]|uniref:DUF7619 domain-containing protein n=1 Tax=Flavobacterium sp. XGLA_31 TaxID=3447666 RepID=UPI003F3AF25E
MKKLYILLLFFAGMVNAQIVNIPDANFKAHLITLGADANADGEIQVSEVSGIPALDVHNLNISDLTGIEYFSSLTFLMCDHNQITSLDLSQNLLLDHLECDSNPLQALFIKNGSSLNTNSILGNIPFICADDFEIAGLSAFYPSSYITSYCSFTPGGNYNSITGSMIFDSNNNGCDASDSLQPNIRINLNDGTSAGANFTSSSGTYTFYTQTGNFTLTPSMENSAWFSISPINAAIPFTDTNNNVATQNFCITANGVHPDIEVIVTPLIPARPGFDAVYKVVYRNKGNQTVSGNLSFEFDDEVLNFVTASIVPNNQSFGNLSWNYNTLSPFESRSITITLHVNTPTDNPAVNIGDVLSFITTLNPFAGDENQSDNTFAFNQTVVGSYDPNNIICLEGSVVPPSEIGNYLHYVVNFENTGTADAENVVVREVIDITKFDVSSLQVLDASHPITAKLTGNVAEFIFQNLSLHSGGHGNILLKIKSKGNLVEGDMVSKNANIYFDYNAPVSTNIENTVFQTLSNPAFETDVTVKVYPNPTKNTITVRGNFAIKSVQLYDVQGRLLLTKLTEGSEAILDVTAHNSGVYFVKVMTDKGMKVERIIKQ